VGLPSLYRDVDTRAGSIELNHYGSHLTGFTTDAPYTSGIVGLRNGAGNLIEQWQLNRVVRPANLDANGCKVVTPADPAKPAYEQCWPQSFAAPLTVTVPIHAGDSNDFFDPESTVRVTVSATSTIDPTDNPTDNSAQWFTITWADPNGLAGDRMNLRLHFDANFNGLQDDPLYPLFRVRFGTPDIHEPIVVVVAQSDTSLTVQVNVQDAIDFVWDQYLGIPGYLP